MAKSTKKSSKAKAAKPKAAKSKTTKPGAAKSKTAKPKAAKPKTTKPKAAKSKAAKPKAAKSKAAKPSAAKSKTAKPSALKKKKVAASSPRAAKAASSREERKGGAATPAKRKLGLRGAAPWAARHAAKHAAEARARAAEPAPPGSARATIRVPSGAEEIKAKIAELHNQTQKIRTLRKRLDKGFFEIGQVLGEIQQQELFQAKGYGSFEAFLERETDLGKQTALKMIKISQVFQHDAAMDYGMDRLIMAINALEGDTTTVIAKPSAPSSQGMKPPPLPLKPPIRTVI